MWLRDPSLRIEDALTAEQFIESVGFCSALTDCRRPGPSLYIAVCGRRDAYMPRNVQKDPESRLAWTIKDEVMQRGRAYYGKLAKGRSTFIARRLIPHFHAIWGIPAHMEPRLLSKDARTVLEILRGEWEMATPDLRQASCINERASFNKVMDELQRSFKMIPIDVMYKPIFTYIWSLAAVRFKDELETRISREEGLKEIARAYLRGAGTTLPGELARITGLSRPDAGSGNWSLVDEGVAARLAPGVYHWREIT